MDLRNRNSVCKAIILGGFCSALYLTSYVYKYLLSNFESILLENESGVFTAKNIALLSTVYLIFYAVGQLINGFLGDRLKPKYMACTGFLLAALSLVVFSMLALKNLLVARAVTYAVLGFGLSMLRSPFTKIITENLNADKARICCASMNAAAVFFGSSIAAFSTVFFSSWKNAYRGAALVAGLCCALCFAIISLFEKSGMAVPVEKASSAGPKSGALGIKELFGFENFTMYLLVAIVMEAIATAVLFLVPTFFKDCLGYSEGEAAVFMTVISVIRGVSPYMTIIIYKLMSTKDNILLRISYIIATVAFLLLLYTCGREELRFISVLILFVAFVGSETAGNMLWSVYIPGLGATGRVSSATGVLDCVGYGGAALGNMVLGSIISKNVKSITLWRYEIAAWAVLALLGFAISFIKTTSRHKE